MSFSYWASSSYAGAADREFRRTSEREAREEQTARAAELEATRQAEYRRAEEAAIAAGATITTELRMHVRHVVDLALVEPRVTISWMAPGSRARKITSGRSIGGRRTIVTPSVRDLRNGGLEDIATCLHELGHQRDTAAKLTTCEREVAATRWALANALAWDRACHTHIVRAVLTYADTEKKDVLGVQAIEAFVAEPFEQYERTLTREQVEAFEDVEFIREHGEQRCQCAKHCHTPKTPAVVVDAGQHVCRACRKVLQVERDISWQRQEVAQMKTLVTDAIDRRIVEQRREFRVMRARQRALAQPGVCAAASYPDRAAFRQAVDALGGQVRAGTVACAGCQSAPATRIRQEFGADGSAGDTYRPLCPMCLARADQASAEFLARMELVWKWRAEARRT